MPRRVGTERRFGCADSPPDVGRNQPAVRFPPEAGLPLLQLIVMMMGMVMMVAVVMRRKQRGQRSEMIHYTLPVVGELLN